MMNKRVRVDFQVTSHFDPSALTKTVDKSDLLYGNLFGTPSIQMEGELNTPVIGMQDPWKLDSDMTVFDDMETWGEDNLITLDKKPETILTPEEDPLDNVLGGVEDDILPVAMEQSVPLAGWHQEGGATCNIDDAVASSINGLLPEEEVSIPIQHFESAIEETATRPSSTARHIVVLSVINPEELITLMQNGCTPEMVKMELPEMSNEEAVTIETPPESDVNIAYSPEPPVATQLRNSPVPRSHSSTELPLCPKLEPEPEPSTSTSSADILDCAEIDQFDLVKFISEEDYEKMLGISKAETTTARIEEPSQEENAEESEEEDDLKDPDWRKGASAFHRPSITPARRTTAASKEKDLRERNNEASRRSRAKRRQRESNLEIQKTLLEKENRRLKAKLQTLESLYTRVKAEVLNSIAKNKK